MIGHDLTNLEFRTERLTVKCWSALQADRDALARLVAELAGILTPATTAFLPPSMQIGTTSDIATWIDGRAGESDVCTIRLLDGTLVGLLILHVSGDIIRVGYLLGEAFWGRGYGTELLQGFVRWCAASGGRYQLIGGVETDNQASIRVLEKAGFALDSDSSSGTNRFYHQRVT